MKRRFALLSAALLLFAFAACDSDTAETTPGTDVVVGADVSCTPSCEGAVCGDDGCGGLCGACTGGLVCEEGACVEIDDICSSAEAIASYCALRECGVNPCGGICGVCSTGETCETSTGLCLEPCTPDCTGLACGPAPNCDDASCGVCPDGETCDEGACVTAGLGDDVGYDYGQVMQNVVIYDIAGNEVDVHSFHREGKVVVFAIGAIWCPYCNDEAYYLSSLKDLYGDDLEVVYVLAEDASGGQIEISEVEQWKRVRMWLNFDVYMTKYNGSGDPFYMFFRGVGSYPQTVLVSGDDMVVRFKTRGFAADAIAYWIKKYVYGL